MIINIWKKQDLDLVKELPIEVLFTIEDTIEILDENYSSNDFSIVVVCKKELKNLIEN